MCGRFARYSLTRELARFFNTRPPDFELHPDYNVAPSQEIPVVVREEDARRIRKRRWGLVPFWAKDTSIGAWMINARAETIATKPAFKSALRHRRCLIPANGFYEWKGKAGSKQPYYFQLPSGELFAFAGLCEIWEDKAALPGEDPYESCTIITTEAADSVKDTHHRMPLILKPEVYDEWLDPQIKEPARIEEIMAKGAVKDLSGHPVSKLVNRVGNNRRKCIEPLKDPAGSKPVETTHEEE